MKSNVCIALDFQTKQEVHDILDQFTNKIKKEHMLWSELSKDKCRDIINELVDTKLKNESNSILNSNKKYMYFSERFKKTITKKLLSFFLKESIIVIE